MAGIKPTYTKSHPWEVYAQQLPIEYTQSMDEGKDIASYEALFQAVADMPLDERKVKMAEVLFSLIEEADTRADFPYREPSGLQEIQESSRAKGQTVSLEYQKDALNSKIHGAWMGRICGCLLGKPVEMMRTNELVPLLQQSGNYPMHRYIRSTDVTEEMRENYAFFKSPRIMNLKPAFVDLISYMPYDDDTNYVVLAQKIIEKYGRSFTPDDVAKEWQFLQPKTAYCTAERVAYCNFGRSVYPPDSASYQNPYREWIGAQIRGDYFGYINPGRPDLAAEMAWRDASISHVKNGIYGEMFVAAMLAAAACTDEMHEIIRAGLDQIPVTSRLYEQVERVVQWYDSGITQEECFEKIHQEWDEYTMHGWCHVISNAMIVTAALLYGEGEFGASICLAVQTGFDTDCNGATVGSILGMRNGIGGIDPVWTDPIGGILETTIFGMGKTEIRELVDLTLRHMESRA